jgi:flagellar basal body-associated protein FliL
LEVGGQHDASRFVEMEIGSFRITHRLVAEQHTMMVKFRLFGIVPENKEERLHEELARFDKRIRDAVISLVQKTEVEQLAEPGLKWLKAELVAAINRVVQDRALQGVAFSDFSMEEV